jgi:MFS family permease
MAFHRRARLNLSKTTGGHCMSGTAVRPGPDERYGRVIISVAFAIMGVTGGLTFYAMSAYINALVSDRGFSLAVASAGPTWSAAFGGLGGLATAKLMKTVSTRTLLAIGTIGLGISTAGIGASHSVWQLWLAFALSGWFGAMASGIPVSALVARWFPAAPARPLTIAMTGLAVGGAIIPPVVLGVISAFGLTKGSVVLGLGLILIVGTANVFVKEPPASLAADTNKLTAQAGRASVRDKLFVMLFVGMLCLFLSQVATTAHMVRLAKENGTGGAALAVSVLALGVFAGRIAGIPLLPAVGLKRIAVGVALTQAAAQFVLSGAHSEWQLFLGTFLLGVAMGNVAILQSLFAIEAYGLDEYPRMFSRINLAAPLGSGIGPLIVALLHGSLNGYRWPLILMGLISAVGGIVLFSTGIDSQSKMGSRSASASSDQVSSEFAEEVAMASVNEISDVSRDVSESLLSAGHRNGSDTSS